MAFIKSLVSIVGSWTRATQYNALAGNVEWLQEKGDVDHDLDITSGSGDHRGVWSAPLVLGTSTGSNQFCALWIDNSGATKRLRVKFGSSRSGSIPSSESDAGSYIIALTQDSTGPTF